MPLDPVYPKERLEFMLTNAEVTVLLTSEGLLSSLPQSRDVAHLVCLDRDWEVIGRESTQRSTQTCERLINKTLTKSYQSVSLT